MSERTVWTCDGCEDEKIVDQSSGDWKKITVEISGFSGYPVGDRCNGIKTFELCPKCQQHLADTANPRAWGRATVALSEDKP